MSIVHYWLIFARKSNYILPGQTAPAKPVKGDYAWSQPVNPAFLEMIPGKGMPILLFPIIGSTPTNQLPYGANPP